MNHFSHSGVFFLASGGQSCDDACAAGGIGHGDGKSLACDLDKVENTFFCHASLQRSAKVFVRELVKFVPAPA